MTPAPRYSLSAADILLRGCEREPPQRLLGSMQEHYASLRTATEWGLSVAAMPSGSEADILKAARQIRQSHYRVTSVSVLDELSDRVIDEVDWASVIWVHAVWDHNAHGLILSHNEPTMDLAASLAAAFGPPKVNPYYEERSRSRARR